MAKYLIDTNVLIDELRGKITIADRLPLEQCALSFVTIGELWQGIKTKEEVKITTKVVEAFTIIWGTQEITETAIDLMHKYTRAQGLYLNDALIAAAALTNDLTLITENQKHFRSIDGLTTITFLEANNSQS